MTETPEFFDGKPVNLEAAALDALEWLKFWRKYLNNNHLGQEWNESRRRMSQVIAALNSFLPKRDPIIRETPKPPTYGAVAILDPVHPALINCTWTYVGYSDLYESACGLTWETGNDYGPHENEMRYCPKCGRQLVVAASEEEE